ncbi:MAG: hypothetical protein H6799_01930 [Candidatus Nomurabacteria bacterium]|nr:MAG: hypothetical protein H6799_01930 [Candidatus Nomurabacteria bacterium]HRV76435.1 hypothetical protein [Candidatus Saccharimonadales bacterium]
MANKYADKTPQPGRCELVDGVRIRIADVDVKHRAGRESQTLTEAGSTQVACPEDVAKRCGGCIVDSLRAQAIHPEWTAVAVGGSRTQAE